MELRTAVAKGVKAIITKVFATFVFWIESTNVAFPRATKNA